MAAKSWNKVELMGNLTRDPELRFTPNGASVCTFGIATNRSYVSEGERKEDVDFHNLVAWNKLAELCNQLLKKGNRVFVSGRLQYREWDGQDGVKRRVAEIVIEDMILLTSRTGVGSEDVSSDMVEAAGFTEAPSSERASTKAKETTTPSPAATTPPATQPAPANEDVSSDDLPF